MTDNEKELINIIRNSDEPEKVFEFALNLFLNYLRSHDQSQDKPRADLEESA